jgi:small-conductance mechanosensitive channel
MIEYISQNKFITSVLFVLVALVVRWLIVRYLHKLPPEELHVSRRWINVINNTVTAIVVVGLIIIWLSELRFVALSIAAFAAALVIATRDIIQCFIGAVYQTGSSAFSIGDWIEVGGETGEVISSDWLTTKLLEVDLETGSYGYTGKTIIVPNNQFVLNPVQNLNHLRRIVHHTFSITREADLVNVFEAKNMMLEKAKSYCGAYDDVVNRALGDVDKRMKMYLADTSPSVRISTSNIGKNEFHISVFCPITEAVNIEQKLMEDFMQFWYAKVHESRLKNEAITNANSEQARRDGNYIDQAAQ